MAIITGTPEASREGVKSSSSSSVLDTIREASNYKTMRVVVGATALLAYVAAAVALAGFVSDSKAQPIELVGAVLAALVVFAIVTAGHQAIRAFLDMADVLVAQEARARRGPGG